MSSDDYSSDPVKCAISFCDDCVLICVGVIEQKKKLQVNEGAASDDEITIGTRTRLCHIRRAGGKQLLR